MSVLPKVMLPSAVLIATAPVVNATVLLKITLSLEVAKFTPAIVAALATVNALLKLESAVLNVTPVPPAVKVVVPVIVPPPVTPFTVIVPAPAAVMFNAPVLVMKSSSVSVRLKPTPAVPKNTLTPALLVILTGPFTMIASPIETSPALAMLRDESGPVFPTVEPKVTMPAPAVKVRACAPLSVPLKVRAPPAVVIATAPVVNATVLLKITLSLEVAKFTPAIVAALATVNALLKLESAVWNDTPDAAVRVVVPVIVPPPVTPFTVIAAPFAVMFNALVPPVLAIRSSSVSVRLKPAPAVPKNTLTPASLVILTGPATLIAAPITTSPALAMVSDVSDGGKLPTVPVKVTMPAPAVKVRS